MATKKKSVKKAKGSFFVVGKQYFIRTVTTYIVGILLDENEHDLMLDKAAFVAHTGRFADAVRTGVFQEVEPFSAPVGVNKSAIVDWTEFPGTLPLSQK